MGLFFQIIRLAVWSGSRKSAFVPAVGSAPDYRVVLGAEIRRRRRRVGITQKRLAEKAELHPNYLGRVERGEETVSLASLRSIAKGLGVGVRGLLRRV